MHQVAYTPIAPVPATQAHPAPPEVFWDLYILAHGCYLPLLHVPTWFILELRGSNTTGSPRDGVTGAAEEDLFILDWIEELGVKFCGFRGELSFDIPRRWAAFRPDPPQDASLVAVDPLCIFSFGNEIATVEQSTLASSEQAPVARPWPVPSLGDILATLHPETRLSKGTTKDRASFVAKLLERDDVSRPTCGFSGAPERWVAETHIISRNMGSPYMCALARKYASSSPWPEDHLHYSIDGSYNGLLTDIKAEPFSIFLTPSRWKREQVVYGGMGPFSSSQHHWDWIKDAPRYTLHFLMRDSFVKDRFFPGTTLCETGKDYKLTDEKVEYGYRLKNPGSYPPPFVCDVSYATAVVAEFRHDGFEILLNALRVEARDLFGFTADGDEELGSDDEDNDDQQRDSERLLHSGLHISDVELCLSLIPRPSVDVSEMPSDYIPAFSRRGNDDALDEDNGGQQRDPERLLHSGQQISDVELCLSLIGRPSLDVSEMPGDYIPAFSRRGNLDERTLMPVESSAENGSVQASLMASLRAQLGNARFPLRDALSDPDPE